MLWEGDFKIGNQHHVASVTDFSDAAIVSCRSAPLLRNHKSAPWRILCADSKKPARLELLRDLLDSFSYRGKDKKIARPDRSLVFEWSKSKQDRIAS